MNRTRPACSGCGKDTSHPIFLNQSAPVALGRLAATPSDARNSVPGTIDLVACEHCGLIENREYDPAIIGFEPGYEVSLLHTPTFCNYIESLCDRLIADHSLNGKRILEIGCGSADFLRMICTNGGNHGVGIDPTIRQNTRERCGSGTMELIPDFYSNRYENMIGDFICSLSVFEDIPNPLDFLKSLRHSIGTRDVRIYFEVFNGYRAISQQEVWSVHYEQCNYFSPESLRNIFRLAGFEITSSGTCYEGDQYIFVEAVPSTASASIECELPDNFINDVHSFADAFSNRVTWWKAKLEQCRRDRRRVVCWGSGGKGLSFLSSVPNSDVIEQVIDINPNRQNHYLPIVSHPIVAPNSLTASKPDVVVVTNALYRNEIQNTLKSMQIDCELVVA